MDLWCAIWSIGVKISNCWCRKSSPIRLLQQSENAIMYECLQCHGSIIVCLDVGEVWKERSSE